ncbi:hypothetical protein H6F93_30045 [Leptolyngbya sp. FACHB-671]|uniref:hypothetical protein n=1 Tax=Leptolyngbya sp. FACHB-671 TaxID=2692812 RepID=UPI001682906F|nr:hypothetical protein [Leptolyngbya sp. FACHB-671]MBD2071713.1 hypothetical protein [Leptolyngbya sp. FACHB-671]
MPVIRLALLLAILGGLTLFALQNWSPAVPLVILGVQTQAFPLAAWMVGAIAAGAFTTLVIAALFGISSTFSAPRTRRPAAPRETSRSTSADESWDKGWAESQNSSYSTAATAAASTDTTTSYTQSASPKPKSSFDFSNDWENVGAPVEEWEDWQDYEEPVDTPPAQASPQASSSYSSSSYNSQTYIQEPEEREEWEDWEEEPDAPPPSPAQPQQTDYEVRRDPKTSYQSGSVYSYSYREPSDSGVGKTESVYDADYRVIIPPARSLDELDNEPASRQDLDEEDWDFEDDFEDEGDRPRR